MEHILKYKSLTSVADRRRRSARLHTHVGSGDLTELFGALSDTEFLAEPRKVQFKTQSRAPVRIWCGFGPGNAEGAAFLQGVWRDSLCVSQPSLSAAETVVKFRV